MSRQKTSISSMRSEMSSDQVREMFNRVAPRYDLLNHVLSFGCDILWRRKLASLIEKNRKLTLVDLATGTGDMLVAALSAPCLIERAVGLDTSEGMLKICRKKIKKRLHSAENVELLTADVTSTNLPPESIDVVTMGFGIRNTLDVSTTLREIHRILKPNGTVLILEFSMPRSSIIRPLYTFHLRYIVPLIGSIISGNRLAYRYLDRTIESFYNAGEFCSIMRSCGFINVSAIPLTFGVASIYLGCKANKTVNN